MSTLPAASGVQLPTTAPLPQRAGKNAFRKDGGRGRIRCRRRFRGPNVLVLSAAGKPIFIRHERGGHGDDDDSDDGSRDELHWSSVCGLIAAVRANTASVLGGGEGWGGNSDVRSIRASNGAVIAFMATESLILVAVSPSSRSRCLKDAGVDDCISETEAWLRLTLEYAYGQVVFALTDRVQSIFRDTPNYDLTGMFGVEGAASLRNLLDRFDPCGDDICEGEGDDTAGGGTSGGTGCGAFLTAGVECVFPISPDVREQASAILLKACHTSPPSRAGADGPGLGALFAMLVVGERLVSLVQPPHRSSQLRASDLHLILTFVGRQPGMPSSRGGGTGGGASSSELWFPLCLPRFDGSGFLYAYVHRLDPREDPNPAGGGNGGGVVGTGLSLVLIGARNDAQQFESFRRAACKVRGGLGLPEEVGEERVIIEGSADGEPLVLSSSSVGGFRMGKKESSGVFLETLDSETKNKTHFDDAVRKEEVSRGDKDAVNDFSSARRAYALAERRHSASDLSVRGNDARFPRLSSPSMSCSGKAKTPPAPLLRELKSAASPQVVDEIMRTYLGIASAVHFVFRCDIYVGNNKGENEGGKSTDHRLIDAGGGGMLTQCFGPPLGFPFVDAPSKRRVWNAYQRLSLRLRLGSSTAESTYDALDMIVDDDENRREASPSVDDRGIGRECPAACLLESPPNVHGVTYLADGPELFVGLNGRFFELYATLSSTIPPRNATAYCARLVRRLMGDERMLFLANPLTWPAQ